MRYLVLVGMCVFSVNVFADPPEDKLDLILKELRTLSQRVDVLEARLRAMDKQLERVSHEVEPVRRAPVDQLRHPLPHGMRPQDVLRMQIEEPGSLLKNIHERERVLRNRIFPADIHFLF